MNLCDSSPFYISTSCGKILTGTAGQYTVPANHGCKTHLPKGYVITFTAADPGLALAVATSSLPNFPITGSAPTGTALNTNSADYTVGLYNPGATSLTFTFTATPKAPASNSDADKNFCGTLFC